MFKIITLAAVSLSLAGLYASQSLAGPTATQIITQTGQIAPVKNLPNIVKVGKYQVELRNPEEGLFAGEETDVEFRVTDTTQKDPVEKGFKGVANVQATGIITMPSMPGMPESKPDIHREGVPGDYGVVCYFPHGGEFQIQLTLTPPNEKPFKASFKVDVKDERTVNLQKAPPYRLQIVDWPRTAKAGQFYQLKMRIIDTKTGKAQTSFDEAHTKLFHLLIASKDLNWFIHEHPEMSADGTWTIQQKFPAGTEYQIYADVAPKGKGSRILMSSVKVQGPKPTWNTKLVLSKSAIDGGLKGLISSTKMPIPIGKMTTVRIKLFDAKTGVAAGDTVKWLGAAGHLMIFHQDRMTVVHSHPREDSINDALVKKGIVQFSARFPKEGIYKVYGQFDWQGAVRTLGFTIEVK